MYIISAVIMLFRGGMDGLTIRAQLTFPETTYLNAEHYNGIFYNTWYSNDSFHGNAIRYGINEPCSTITNWCS